MKPRRPFFAFAAVLCLLMGGRLACAESTAPVFSDEPVFVGRRTDDRPLASLVPFAPGEVTVGGEFGRRLQLSVDKMLKHTDIENTFAKHFKVRHEKPGVKGGFAGYGMFLDALVKAAAHGIGGEATVGAKTRLLAEIAATQGEDGSITMFSKEPGCWDNHEQAYLIQAFVRDWKYFRCEASLATARRLADFLIAVKSPMTLGTETAFALLAAETKDPRYAEWLRTKYMIAAPIDDYDRKLSVNGVMHVYTYLARALGQIDYADAVGAEGEDRAHLTEAAEKAFRRVQGPYLSISGSLTGTPGWGELWDASQTGTGTWGETCASAYLMRLAAKRIERDASTYYGDLFERIAYNAFFSAQSEDGLKYKYWTTFNERSPWYERDTYCCPNNFRREVFEIPDMVFFRTPDGALVVNLYSDAELKSGAYQVKMTTAYPEAGRIALEVRMPGKKLHLRIPGWCAKARVRVENGPAVEARPGWHEVTADFGSVRHVELELEIPIRLVKGIRAQEGRVAVCRGPLVYGFAPGTGNLPKGGPWAWAIDLSKPVVWSESDKVPVATFVRRTQGRRVETAPLARYASEDRLFTFMDFVIGGGTGRTAVPIAEDTANFEIRPGGVDGRPFWNVNAIMFMYPPAFDFVCVAGAANYRFDVTDEKGVLRTFLADRPTVSLAPLWRELPTGYVTVVATALDAAGEALGRAGARTFWKKAPFRAGAYEPAARPYDVALRMMYDNIWDSPTNRSFRETGKLHPKGQIVRYPSKLLASVIGGMVRYAKLRPDRREDALAYARQAADYLIALAQPEGTPLAHFPPTYHPDHELAGFERHRIGTTMILYPAFAANAYLELFDATGEAKYRDEAIAVAATFLRTQGKDGTWYLKLDEKTGEPLKSRNKTLENRAMPLPMMELFERLYKLTGEAKYRAAADRAFAFIEEGPLKTWNWEGQFEDVDPEPPYFNLTKHGACSTAVYLLKRFPGDAARLAQARELLRFAEDQFVQWEPPYAGHNPPRPHEYPSVRYGDICSSANLMTPCVFEQYRCFQPVDASAAKLMHTYLAFYRAEGKPIDLAKARALADTMTRAMGEDGIEWTWWRKNNNGKDLWTNCMLYSAKILAELIEVEQKEN